MSLRWLAAGATSVIATVALVALGAWYFFLRDVAEPASVAEAVAAFREQRAAGDESAPIPVGVYVYDTRGMERTDALGGVTHRYPAASTLSVTADPCGGRLRWDVLEGRFTTWTLCVEPAGWSLEAREERHTFFGIADQTTYTCSGTPFRPEGDTPGTAFTVSCTTGSTTERGRGLVVGREPLHVSGTTVDCVHVRTGTSFAGATTGTASFDFWLARETGLPIRIRMASRTTNDSPIGDVHYEEDVTLDLTSLTPRR
jgi:hypothetical protein